MFITYGQNSRKQTFPVIALPYFEFIMLPGINCSLTIYKIIISGFCEFVCSNCIDVKTKNLYLLSGFSVIFFMKSREKRGLLVMASFCNNHTNAFYNLLSLGFVVFRSYNAPFGILFTNGTIDPPYLISPDPVGAFVMYPICSSEMFNRFARSSLSFAD